MKLKRVRTQEIKVGNTYMVHVVMKHGPGIDLNNGYKIIDRNHFDKYYLTKIASININLNSIYVGHVPCNSRNGKFGYFNYHEDKQEYGIVDVFEILN